MINKFQQATSFLMFSALSEIMLDMYQNTRSIAFYDPALEKRLKHMRVHFERVTERAFKMFPEEEQISFMHMITVFEKLVESAYDQQKFSELMGLIESWQNGDITMINTREELVKAANEADNKKLETA